MVAEKIIELLGESEPDPQASIMRICEVLGEDQAWMLAQEALRIQSEEGLLTQSRERKRTTGGIFFFLVAGRVDLLQYKAIWAKRKVPWFIWKKAEELKQQKHGYAPWAYDELMGMARALAKVAGVGKVEIKLVGKHGKVIKRKDLVITAVSSTIPREDLPKGLPKPPTDPTVYICYLSLAQWDALPHPCETIQVEGYAALDLENLSGNMIAVWAKQVIPG